MSKIEMYRVSREVRTRELWDKYDIAEYCGIDDEKAAKLHEIANKACGVIGYGDIRKDDFIEFYESIMAIKESRHLQDEANASIIVNNERSHSFDKFKFWFSQVVSLLSNH